MSGRKRQRNDSANIVAESAAKRTKVSEGTNELAHQAAHHRHFFHIEAPVRRVFKPFVIFFLICCLSWDGKNPSLFLAGGISGCSDWQASVAEAFASLCPDLVLLNPRRKNFNVSDDSESVKQIHWEFEHLRKASAILFWFPHETLCPITLFELGQWSVLAGVLGKRLFVGCDPKYLRRVRSLVIFVSWAISNSFSGGRGNPTVTCLPDCSRCGFVESAFGSGRGVVFEGQPENRSGLYCAMIILAVLYIKCTAPVKTRPRVTAARQWAMGLAKRVIPCFNLRFCAV